MENKKQIRQDLDKIKSNIIEIKKILSEIDIEDFNYLEYKKTTNEDDIKKFSDFNKIKWYWFIPIIGFIWFNADLSINMEKIDRGFVRSEWTKTTWILIIPYSILSIFSLYIFNLMPFFEIYVIRKISIKRINKIIKEK